MKSLRLTCRSILALELLATCVNWASGTAGSGRVELIRTPEGGIQPQVQVDGAGTAHLVYLKGDPAAADIYYVWRKPRSQGFSQPLRVNSRPGSAIAVGTVRGAHLAIGKGNRIHVAWMGSKSSEPRGPSDATPMLYTRLNDAGTAFESERNVMQFATGLDGGASVAADTVGNVYVAWHARGAVEGEENRMVWVARSRDEGRIFAREAGIFDEPTGACGCCGMRAHGDNAGRIYVLYRSARERIDRDMYLLYSQPGGGRFRGIRLHPWKINACPMSTASIDLGLNSILLAWETAGQVYFSRFDPVAESVSDPVAPPGGGGKRRPPAVAANARGETILVWTEGTGWNRGGTLAWQVFEREGRPTGQGGEAPGVPVWSLATAFPLPDGNFAVVY